MGGRRRRGNAIHRAPKSLQKGGFVDSQALDLQETELNKLIREIRDVLWPPEDPDEPWSPDTLDKIAMTLALYGVKKPQRKSGRTRKQPKR